MSKDNMNARHDENVRMCVINMYANTHDLYQYIEASDTLDLDRREKELTRRRGNWTFFFLPFYHIEQSGISLGDDDEHLQVRRSRCISNENQTDDSLLLFLAGDCLHAGSLAAAAAHLLAHSFFAAENIQD